MVEYLSKVICVKHMVNMLINHPPLELNLDLGKENEILKIEINRIAKSG